MANSDSLTFYQRLLGAAALAIVALLVYRIVEPFLGPIAWALFIGFLLQPQQEKLTKWLRGRPSASAFTLTMLVLILFLGPLTALAIAFARQAAYLAGRLLDWVGGPQGEGLRQIDQIPVVGRALEWLDQNLAITTAQIQSWLIEGGRNLFQDLASYGGVAFLGAGLVPLPADQREALADRLATVTRAVVRGTVLTSMIQGLLLGLGFAIVGLPAPVVFGVLAAVLSVVPFGGTALVWIPALATLLVQGRYGQAVGILLVGVVVSSVDNFIKPMLISGRSPLPTLAVFIGVLGGLAAFGLIGLFVGPVVIALVLALIEFTREKKR